MYISIALAVGAFVLVMAALFYDTAEGRFRVSFWDSETFRFVDPGRMVTVLVALAGIVLVVSVGQGGHRRQATRRSRGGGDPPAAQGRVQDHRARDQHPH